MPTVCVLGSANLDLVATVERLPRPGETVLADTYAEHPGGKGLNQAVAATRSGSSVRFVGAVGADDAGRRLRAVIDHEGIEASLASAGAPTGRAMIGVDRSAENSIIVVPGANAAVAAPPPPLLRADVLLVQLEIPLDIVATAARTATLAGTLVVLNPAPAARLPDELVSACDVVVPNEHELDLLGGTDELLERGVGVVVVTRGRHGADVVDRRGTRHVPPFPVAPVDTTGAGDAFCGALAARLAHGDDIDTAVRWAAAAGALAATAEGAVPAQPRAEAIAALLSASS